ncbi:MAG: pyridoxal-phosphate dependent enzyme [Pirellulales bacterium]|nr:pyridoxal-phosphate dependent enzyme [Pirellulales bacterium]
MSTASQCDSRSQIHAAMDAARLVLRDVDTLAPLQLLNFRCGPVWVKREDLSQIRSFKWRGAYFRMHGLWRDGVRRVVAASAGNHAQGVARAARKLNMNATVFMPQSTPAIKQAQVRQLGGDHVDVVLSGDSFATTARAAASDAAKRDLHVVDPFDHSDIIAGQATIGFEMLEQSSEFDALYLPIGGGGLAAGVACAIKRAAPRIRVIGVEVVDQDSMSRSIRAGKLVTLPEVSRFCDGTAVSQPGKLTFELCRDLLDQTIIVTEDEVCAAIQTLWEADRIIPEPSGAVGLAGVLQAAHNGSPGRPATIITGANMDFTTLERIAQRAGIGRRTRKYYRFRIEERAGALLSVLDGLKDRANIVEFQYGKVDQHRACPVIGFECLGTDECSDLHDAVSQLPVSADDITGTEMVDFRMIPFERRLCHDPLFARIDFADRPGALHSLLREIGSTANICYFNYHSSGELSGRALMAFESTVNRWQEKLAERVGRLEFTMSIVPEAGEWTSLVTSSTELGAENIST